MPIYPYLNQVVPLVTAMVKSTRATKPAKNAHTMSHHSSHPPWTDMITVRGNIRYLITSETMLCQECITTTPDGIRNGVSRPAIKKVGLSRSTISSELNTSKFIDSEYHLPMDSASASQLNRAIGHGTHTGNFVLPKGRSPMHL